MKENYAEFNATANAAFNKKPKISKKERRARST